MQTMHSHVICLRLQSIWHTYLYFAVSYWPDVNQKQVVVLGSTCKATMETHFNTKSILTCDVQDLIVPAARNWVVGVSSTTFSSHWHTLIDDVSTDISSYCTIQLSQKESLQWVLDSTDHPENQAYATQANCPAGMLLNEYLEYARIRAGGHLQFTNIVRALHEGLDFSKSHTFDLCLQALLQVGPMEEGKVWLKMPPCTLFSSTLLSH